MYGIHITSFKCPPQFTTIFHSCTNPSGPIFNDSTAKVRLNLSDGLIYVYFMVICCL